MVRLTAQVVESTYSKATSSHRSNIWFEIWKKKSALITLWAWRHDRPSLTLGGCANEILVEQKSANCLSEGWKTLC